MDNRLQELYTALNSTEDFMEQLDIQIAIDEIKISTGEITPAKMVVSEYECIGCSS